MACHNLAIKMINTNPKSVWCCQLQQISTALSTGKRLIFTISSFWSRCCEWIRQCSTNVARRVSSQQQWWNGRPSRNLWITLLPSQIQRVKACGENRENLPWKNLSGGRILYEPAKDLGLSLLILFDLQVPMSKVATVPKQACQKNMNIKTRMEAYAANTWQPTYQSIWWYIPVFFSSASLRFGTLYVTAQYGTSWHIAQRKIYSSSN